MATSPESITLNKIVQVESYQDELIGEMARVYRTLQKRLTQYLATANQTGAVDTSLAMQEIEVILTESGYYKVGGQLLNDGYASALGASTEAYAEIYGAAVQYNGDALNTLNALRNSQIQSIGTLSNDLKTKLSQTVMRSTFGLLDYNEAVESISKAIEGSVANAETWIRTSISEAHRTSTMLLGEELGITKYRYYGPDDKLTRPFCDEHLNQIKSMDEWKKIPNGQIGTAATNCGGFNCRHRLVPVGQMQ